MLVLEKFLTALQFVFEKWLVFVCGFNNMVLHEENLYFLTILNGE